jgi:hypothetical protein
VGFFYNLDFILDLEFVSDIFRMAFLPQPRPQRAGKEGVPRKRPYRKASPAIDFLLKLLYNHSTFIKHDVGIPVTAQPRAESDRGS